MFGFSENIKKSEASESYSSSYSFNNKNKKKDKKSKKKYENISIETLYPKSKINKEFDVNSFNTNLLDIENFDTDKLIKERENREKKLKTVYKKLLGTCLHKIQILNDRDETDMVYNVPQIYYGFSKYEPFDCLTYIEKKLRKKYLDTYILSETKIFISWKNIEENKKIQKELDN
uniref:Uncharacterized protein n=1 Tax=viral metagenome TaxID=1070528 RepID=A0A6C0ABZ1_9ZZZZ